MSIGKIINEVNKELSIKNLMVFKDCFQEFEWGIVFRYQSKDFIDKGDVDKMLIGTGEILYDKIDKSINFLTGRILDQELESYRIQKGYPHVIKFPLQGELNELSELEQVILLMRTGEQFQIEKALRVIHEKKLFDVRKLLEAMKGAKVVDVVRDILLYMDTDTIHYYESDIDRIPDEIILQKKHIKNLHIEHGRVVEIPEYIIELEELESIYIYNTPIRKIPTDYRRLKKLREIHLERTLIQKAKMADIKTNLDCKVIIEDPKRENYFS